MKTLALMLALACCPGWLPAEEHKVIAVSEWSEPVENHDHFLRARVLVLEGRCVPTPGPMPRCSSMLKSKTPTAPGASRSEFTSTLRAA